MWDKILAFLQTAGWKLLWVVVALIVGIIVIKLVVKGMSALLKRTKMDGAVIHFVVQILKVGLWLLLIFTCLSLLNVPITGMVAVVSAVTLAIGVSLQGSLSNLASGIIIAASKPFREGDMIELDGVMGTVKTINFFTSEIMTFDNKKIILPNGKITSSTIINYSNQENRMIPLVISVAYESDMELVKQTLLEIADNHPEVLKDPAPTVRLAEFAESSINFNFRMWTATSKYATVLWDINEAIFEAFKERGISIPYNQMDVLIKNDEQKLPPAQPKPTKKGDSIAKPVEDKPKAIEAKEEPLAINAPEADSEKSQIAAVITEKPDAKAKK